MNSTPRALTIEACRTEEKLEQLRPLWNALVDRCPAPALSLTYEWLTTWWNCFREANRELFVLAVREGDRLIGIAPLMKVRRRWCGIPYVSIEFISQRRYAFSHLMMSPHLDVIACERHRDVITAVLSFLQAGGGVWHILRLDTIPDDSATLPALRTEAPVHQLSVEDGVSFESYVINAPEGWSAYLAGRGEKFRTQLGYAERRLHRLGTISITHVNRVEDAGKAFAALLDVERRSWKWRRGLSINSVGYRNFYEAFLSVASERGWLQLTTILLDGVPIAYCYSVSYAGTVEALRTSFDSAWAKYSPGTIVLLKQFQETIERGHSRIHLMGGAEGYKRHWYTDVRMYRERFVFNRNIRSRLFRCAWMQLRLYGRLRFIPGYTKRILRRMNVVIPSSELTRKDQVS